MSAGIQWAVIQRKGKARAAQESQAKPLNPIKKQAFKIANGRRVPLTAVLGKKWVPKFLRCKKVSNLTYAA